MKKQLLKSMLMAVVGVGMMAGGAMADPTAADYFTITDSNTESATIITDLDSFFDAKLFFGFGYEFGIYAKDDSNNRFAILTSLASPGQVFFNNISGNWYIDDNSNVTNADQLFSNTFGFYFTDRNGAHFTDSSLNGGVEYISIDYVPVIATTSFDFVGSGPLGIMRYHGDMDIITHDVAPIPEPATMLLFGTGIAGLAGIARRRKVN